jgi:hypothetical protein
VKKEAKPFDNAYRIEHLKHAILSAILAYLGGGFLAGMVWCHDCGFNIFGRIFVSIITGFLSIFSFGFPPANEGNVGASLNTWPYIFICWLAIYARWFYLHLKKSGKNQPET